MSTLDYKKFEDGTGGPSMSKGGDGKWKKNTTGVSVKNPTPKVNARKIDGNAKKIAKLMEMVKKKSFRDKSARGVEGRHTLPK